jgi:hypothetical protein
VANPSQLESVVSVSLAGTSGFFTPTGLGDIQVPPGSVTSVDLSSAVGGKASAVRVQSRVPVTATVRSTTATDSSYAAPVVPLVGPAAAPVLRGVATTVQVTAGRLESRARVRGYDAAGHRMGGARLVVKPRTTTTWKPGPRAAYVVVTPLRGSIYGAVTLSGAGISEVPLVSLPVRIQRPQVLPATG